MDVIVDSSVWIAYLNGELIPEVDRAASANAVVLAPLVVAEILSGDLSIDERFTFGELLQDFPMQDTPLAHWISLGELRRTLRRRGINVTLPDAHVAQCALDRGALLLTRDDIFSLIATHTALRVTICARNGGSLA